MEQDRGKIGRTDDDISIFFSGEQSSSTLMGKLEMFFKHYQLQLQGENELIVYDMRNGNRLTTVIAPRANRITNISRLSENTNTFRSYSEGVLEVTINTEKEIEKYLILLS